MLKQSTVPATFTTFTIDRRYDATPARVFAAWAESDAKARWFVGPEDWKLVERTLDFRVGGRERLEGRFGDGRTTLYEGRYEDIVPERRIVFAYAMHADGKRISVSLATVEFQVDAAGTRLVFTEQAAFLDGFDDGGGRERGTRALLGRLATALGTR